MPNAESFQTARKTLPVFFLLSPVVNEHQSALRKKIMEEFEKQLSDQLDAIAMYTILSIGQLTSIQTKELEKSLSSINCSQLLDLDCAFSQLDHALSRKTMLHSMYGTHFPIIIYLGECSQNLCQYTHHLKDNKWFRRSSKLAIFSEEESRAHFAGFYNTEECCFLCNDMADAKRTVKAALSIVLRTSGAISGTIPSLDLREWTEKPDGSLVLVDPVSENNATKESMDDIWNSDWDDWG